METQCEGEDVKFVWSCWLSAAFLVLLPGCGKKGPNIELVFVSGTAIMDGRPLEGASIVFIPLKSQQPQPSWGFTDADGNYSLKSSQGKVGTATGPYRIVISKMVMADGSPIPAGSQTGGADGKELIPYPHSDPRQSTHLVEVTQDGDMFDLFLESDAKKPNKK